MKRAAVALVAVALGVAGCGGDDNETDGGSAQESPAPADTAPAEPAGGNVVDMNDQLTVEPTELEVSGGDGVTGKNGGKIGHTVTADKSKAADPSLVSIPAGTKKWDSGFVNEGKSFSQKFDKPGTYRTSAFPTREQGWSEPSS